MEFIQNFVLVLSLVFGSLNPFAPITIATNGGNDTQVVEEQTEPEQVLTDEVNTEEVNTYKINNFIETDLEGFCTVGIPQSHFTIGSESTFTRKYMLYKDNRSKVTMSYITKMSTDTDIPGYITTEVAGVDTFTNDKQIEHYGDNIEWMMIPSQKQEDNCNVYVWYTLSKDGTAAFWCKLKVVPESDTEEIHQVMGKIFDSYYNYYHNGTVFDTPGSGYYAYTIYDDGTVGDISNYRRNDLAYNVFKTRGGYVEGADISADWRDLEIILDYKKFSLPCKLEDFYNAGYILNDATKASDQVNVLKGFITDVKLINENGTVITATVLNESNTEYKTIDECKVVTLSVDQRDFVDVTDKELIQALDNKDGKEEQEEIVEETVKEEAKTIVEVTKDVNLRAEPNTDCEIYKEAHPGEQFEFIDYADNGWFHIKYEDKEDGAYMSSKFGKIIEGTETTDIDDTDDESNTDTDDKTPTDSNEIYEGKSDGQGNHYTSDGKGGFKLVRDSDGLNPDSTLAANPDTLWTMEDAYINSELADRKSDALAAGKEFDEEAEREAIIKEMQQGKAKKDNTVDIDDTDKQNNDSTEYTSNNKATYNAGSFKSSYDTSNIDGDITDEFRKSNEYFKHQMILMGGVTWSVYREDLKAYVGEPSSESSTLNKGGEKLSVLTWKDSNKSMVITMGSTKTIYKVVISCLADGYTAKQD